MQLLPTIKKTIVNNKILLIFILAFILNGCYSNETVDQKVTIRNSENYAYEIQIRVQNEGRGNIHTLDMKKYEFESSDWIYLNSKQGKIESSDIILTHFQDKTEYPWNQKELKGYIEFINDSLIIKLKKPYYAEGSEKPNYWVDYKYNGKYLTESTE